MRFHIPLTLTVEKTEAGLKVEAGPLLVALVMVFVLWHCA